MDSKPNSHRLVLCKQPHKNRHIRREKAIFPTMSKWQFGKTEKVEPKKNHEKLPTFGQTWEG